MCYSLNLKISELLGTLLFNPRVQHEMQWDYLSVLNEKPFFCTWPKTDFFQRYVSGSTAEPEHWKQARGVSTSSPQCLQLQIIKPSFHSNEGSYYNRRSRLTWCVPVRPMTEQQVKDLFRTFLFFPPPPGSDGRKHSWKTFAIWSHRVPGNVKELQLEIRIIAPGISKKNCKNKKLKQKFWPWWYSTQNWGQFRESCYHRVHSWRQPFLQGNWCLTELFIGKPLITIWGS